MNHRTDEYGGNFENRCRFNYEAIEAIRANMPDDMPLFLRVDGIDELMKENMTEEEIVAYINGCAERGVDVADISRGNALSFATVYEVPPFNLPHGFNIDNIANIKNQINIPVVGVGRITTGEMANKVIEEGKFDLVAVGRSQLADPHWVEKVREGREDEIRHCIGCTQGCYDAVIDPTMTHITCTRNPMCCLEYKGLPKTDAPKKVMIIGAGMGGMVAAQILKKRGHDPVIYEAHDHMGGQFLLAGVAPMKQDFKAAAEFEAAQVEKMNIPVHLNTKVTAEVIENEKPDEVIIATGAHYVAPEIPGIHGKNVYSQYQVLRGQAEPEGNVVVIGCGSVGVEVSEYLAMKGAKVTAAEAKGAGRGLNMLRKMFMHPEFKYYGIKALSGANITEIKEDSVHFVSQDRKTKEITEGDIPCDAVVVCTGIKSVPTDDLTASCEKMNIPYHVIGDAKETRDARFATAEAYETAMEI